MAVYGNNIEKYMFLSKSIYENDIFFGEIVINEGVGSIFKKILEGIAGAIKAVIKAIGGFISNIIDKLKSIMNRTPNNSNPTTNKSTTNNNSNPTTNKSDSIEKFKKEKYEFLNTKISDIVKTNPYGSLGFKAYMETYSVLDYLLDSFNTGYLTKSLPILIKDSFPSNFKNIDFKIKLNSDELINYDFVCDLSNKDGAKIEDFLKIITPVH